MVVHNVSREARLWLIVEHVLPIPTSVSKHLPSIYHKIVTFRYSEYVQYLKCSLGGTCYIWKESYTNKATNVLEHEIINRACDVKDVRSMNTYSELSSSANDMKICNGDLCNAPDLSGSSSLLAPALAAVLIALL